MEVTNMVDPDTLVVLGYVSMAITAIVQVLKELMPNLSARLILVLVAMVATGIYSWQIDDMKLTTMSIIFAVLTTTPAGTYSFLSSDKNITQ